MKKISLIITAICCSIVLIFGGCTAGYFGSSSFRNWVDTTIFSQTEESRKQDAKIKELKLTLSALNALLDDKVVETEALNKDIEKLQNDKQSLVVETNNLNNTIEILTTQKNINAQEIEALTIERDNLQSELDGNNSELENLNLQLIEKQSKIEELENSISSNEELIVELNNQVDCLNIAIEQKENQVQNLSLSIENLNNTISALNSSVSDKEAQIANLEAQIANINAEIELKNTEIADLNASISDLNLTIVSQQTLVNQLQQTIINLENDIQVQESEIEELKNQVLALQVFLGKFSSFADSTWEEIAFISSKGLASSVYNVGDTKTIVLSTGEELTLAILDFEHDDLSNGDGKAGITIGLTCALNDTYKMHSANTGYKWSTSAMRTTHLVNIFSTLPSELQLCIKDVDKITYDYYSKKEYITTSEKLFLLSAIEISSYDALASVNETVNRGFYEGSPYQYFRTDINEYSTLPTKMLTSAGDAAYWFLRSGSAKTTTDVRYVGSDGFAGSNYTTSPGVNARHVVFAFCI